MDLGSLGPGDVLADKFRLDSLLGQGGMGSVWRAHHLTLNSPVALKLIDPSLAIHPDARARFMREAQAAAALRSPHVVQTFDFGLHADIPYIAMELLEGESLADRLERETTITPQLAAQVMTHVARAMSKAHDAGIVHRDLKPDNIFLVHNEDEEIAKVLDFGVAKATGTTSLGSDSRTRTGALLGTPYYMSPEQAQGDRTVDWRSDLWSMAIITYECLLGQRPFDSDGLGNLLVQICVAPVPVPSQRGAVPPGFDAWFAWATQRDPTQRPQSAREFAKTLKLALTGDSTRLSESSSPGFDPSGRPLEVGGYPGAGTGSQPGIAGGSQPGLAGGSQPGLADGSQPGLGSQSGMTRLVDARPGTAGGSQPGMAVVATTGAGTASRLTTGGIGAAEVEPDPVAIPKKSSLGIVLGLLAVLVVAGAGVAFVTTGWGSGEGSEVAEPAASAEPDAVSAASAANDEELGVAPDVLVEPAASASGSTAATSPPPAAAPRPPVTALRPTTPTRPPPRVTSTARPTAPPPVRPPPPPPPATTTTKPPARPKDRLGF